MRFVLVRLAADDFELHHKWGPDSGAKGCPSGKGPACLADLQKRGLGFQTKIGISRIQKLLALDSHGSGCDPVCSGFGSSLCRWFLAQNPPALAKLEEELDTAGLLKSPKNPHPRSFTYGDIGRLHWLDCCIKVSAMSLLTAVGRMRKCWSLSASQGVSAAATCSVLMP